MRLPGGRRALAALSLVLPLAMVAGVVLGRGGFGAGDLPAMAVASAQSMRATGTLGWVALVVIEVLVVASGVLPAALVGIAAGAVYGVGLGFPLAAASLMAGALLTFALTRSLFRPWVARLLPGRPRLTALDGLVAHDGWRLVCLLRVSPVMPFALTSYALGLSAIRTRAYLLGTLASLPALLGYVVAGQVAGALARDWNGGAAPWHLAGLALGALATVILTLRLGQLARRAGLMGGAQNNSTISGTIHAP
ncbi:MAG: VTT domain-containing protein [Azospirillaceae bacterium]|nr:VTT domain-containing protein [Azospirillaceae bacterium]